MARPVPKWARRVAPYTSILGSTMMLVGMVIALVIENDVLATIASVRLVLAVEKKKFSDTSFQNNKPKTGTRCRVHVRI